jgi:APA family basic amino acid/polyamine antiporter
MALMAMCGALCYSELAVRFPESGGDYIYLRAGFGDRIAFLYGWMSTIVMYPGVAASLAVGSAAYVAVLVPREPWFATFFPALLLIIFGGVNLLGTAFSGRLVSIVNVLKFVLLFGLVAWAALSGKAHIANLTSFSIRRSGSDSLFGAIVGAFFSFGGWWEAGKIAGEVRNPKRTLPLAFVGGLALVIVIYLLVSFTFIAVIPLGQMTSSTAFVAQFGAALFGNAGAKVLSGCVLLCVFGGMSALMMAAPRVSFAMAQLGTFFAPFAYLSRRFKTPVNAVLLQTSLALLLLLFGAFDRMLAYIIFAAVVFLGLTASTLFRLPERVDAWWFPIAPIFFFVCCAVLTLLIMMHDPLPALIGTVVVLCGDPAGRWIEHQRTAPRPIDLERN